MGSDGEPEVVKRYDGCPKTKNIAGLAGYSGMSVLGTAVLWIILNGTPGMRSVSESYMWIIQARGALSKIPHTGTGRRFRKMEKICNL